MLLSDQNLQLCTNTLKVRYQKIDQVGSNCKEKYFKFIGYVLDDKLSWKGHIQHVEKKTCKCKLWLEFFKEFPTPKRKKNCMTNE